MKEVSPEGYNSKIDPPLLVIRFLCPVFVQRFCTNSIGIFHAELGVKIKTWPGRDGQKGY